MSAREDFARAIFIADNANLDTPQAVKDWDENREHHDYAFAIADGLIAAGYRQIFDGDCGLSGIEDPTDREATEAWMRWASLALNDEIGAIGAMKQMLTEFGYRKGGPA